MREQTPLQLVQLKVSRFQKGAVTKERVWMMNPPMAGPVSELICEHEKSSVDVRR
jgi:hypothetical protein